MDSQQLFFALRRPWTAWAARVGTLLVAGALLAATPLGAAAAAPTAPTELSFGIIAEERAGAMRQMWEPFLADLAQAIGIPVKGFYALDYAAIVQAQRFKKVQLAWYGNLAAVDAVDRANGEVFAQFVDLDGTPGYYSYLICPADSAIQDLQQVLHSPGRYSLGIGDPSSLSGTLVPAYYAFALNHIDPQTHFRVVRSSNHEGNLLSVLNHQVDIATSNSELLQKLQETAPEKYRQIRVLWTSPLMPRDPLVWDQDLPSNLKQRIRSFVLGYGKSDHEKQVLKNLYHLAGFRASSNAQLHFTRALRLQLERRKLLDDTHVSAQERTQALQRIDAALKALAGPDQPGPAP